MKEVINEFMERVRAEFDEPVYVDYKIRYVDQPGEADVRIGANHTLADYLVMGAVALAKSVRGETGEILVYDLADEIRETVKVFKENECYEVGINSNTFLEIHKPIDEAYNALYVGGTAVLGLGIAVGMTLTTHFAGIDVLPSEIVEKIKFTDFNDIKTAEEDAFILMKEICASSVGGIFSEMME